MARQCRYDLGDELRLRGTFQNEAGAATDPSAVYFQLRSPSGTETEYQYGVDPEVMKDGVGSYYVQFLPAEASSTQAWSCRVKGAGVVNQTSEQTFWVLPPRFSAP